MIGTLELDSGVEPFAQTLRIDRRSPELKAGAIFPPVFSLLVDGAEEHAASAADFDSARFGGQGYHADGIGASGVRDFYSV